MKISYICVFVFVIECAYDIEEVNR